MTRTLPLLTICLCALFISGCATKSKPVQLSQNPQVIVKTNPSQLRLPSSDEMLSVQSKNSLKVAFSTKPTNGELSSHFGPRKLGRKKSAKFHSGIDIRAKKGTPVVASAAGKVVFVGQKGAYGKMVEIDHGHGMLTRYAHLDSFTVQEGTLVAEGKTIGTVGRTGRTTGANLHFEIVIDDKQINPLKMAEWS